MPKKNIPLLKRLRTRFLRMRHPKHFRMRQIAVKTDCGAAMCFIGHTLDLAGYKMRLKTVLNPSKDASRSDYVFISPKGKFVSEPIDEATRLLGLDPAAFGEAYQFFHDYSIKTPKQAAKRIERLISVNVPTR